MTTDDFKISTPKKFPEKCIVFELKSIIGFDQYAHQEKAWDKSDVTLKAIHWDNINKLVERLVVDKVGRYKRGGTLQENGLDRCYLLQSSHLLLCLVSFDKIAVSDLIYFGVNIFIYFLFILER